MTSKISPSRPHSFSCREENEECLGCSSFISVAYINGRRIVFDTRYPCMDTKDWWRNSPPSSPPQNHSVGCPTSQRSGMAFSMENAERSTARHATPLSCNPSNAEPFRIPGDREACGSIISIFPSSRCASSSPSTLSFRGEDRLMERPPSQGREKKRGEEKKEGKRPAIIEQERRETSLAWETPLFLVDYTTLWCSEVSERKRCKPLPHSSSSSSSPSCVSFSNVSEVEEEAMGGRAPAHEDTIHQHSAESLSQGDPPEEDFPCFHVHEEKKKEEEEVGVAKSPLPTRAPSLTSSNSPISVNHPSPSSSFASFQQATEQEGDKMSEGEDRSEEMRDEEEAFMKLKKALQDGTTTLPPFPIVLMLPTTTTINVSEGTFPAPVPLPEEKIAAGTTIGLGLALRPTSQGNTSAVNPSHSLPHGAESGEVQCTEGTTFPNTNAPPLRPLPSFSTPSPTTGVGGGGAGPTSAGLDSGRNLLSTVSHVRLQPYHHYHTVAFNPESSPLMAGQWDAAQCIEDLCVSQHTSCPSQYHHSPSSSDFSPSSLHFNKRRRSHPLFMWKRERKRWFPRSSDCSFADRSSEKRNEENWKKEITGEEGNSVVSTPQWAQEEQKGFSMFRALLSSSVHKEKVGPNTLRTECNDEVVESVQGEQAQLALTLCPPSHERLLAEQYSSLSPSDLAYLQSPFVRPPISGSTSSTGSPSFSSSSSSSSELLSLKNMWSSRTSLIEMGDFTPCSTGVQEMEQGMGVVCSSSSPALSLPLGEEKRGKKGLCSGCTTSSGAKVESRRKAKEKPLGDALFRPKKVKLKKETENFLLELRKRSK